MNKSTGRPEKLQLPQRHLIKSDATINCHGSQQQHHVPSDTLRNCLGGQQMRHLADDVINCHGGQQQQQTSTPKRTDASSAIPGSTAAWVRQLTF
jgi:hypothetical protein